MKIWPRTSKVTSELSSIQTLPNCSTFYFYLPLSRTGSAEDPAVLCQSESLNQRISERQPQYPLLEGSHMPGECADTELNILQRGVSSKQMHGFAISRLQAPKNTSLPEEHENQWGKQIRFWYWTFSFLTFSKSCYFITEFKGPYMLGRKKSWNSFLCFFQLYWHIIDK